MLSAAFVKLFQIPTVSFHMGEDACSIDLDIAVVSAEQVVAAERLANEVILENRAVTVRYVTRDEAEKLGLRKIPPAERDMLRLVEVSEFDLCACGGTHVSGTGQIGSILLRKTERVKQGWRVEFVCGLRAVETARRDYTTLVEAAALPLLLPGLVALAAVETAALPLPAGFRLRLLFLLARAAEIACSVRTLRTRFLAGRLALLTHLLTLLTCRLALGAGALAFGLGGRGHGRCGCRRRGQENRENEFTHDADFLTFPAP